MHKIQSSKSGCEGLLAVLAGAGMLGFAAIFVKWGLQGGATPLTIGLYRMTFALPFILWLVSREKRPGVGRGAVWGLLAGCFFASDLFLWHNSLRFTSAANSTFLVCGLTPVWVALFSVAVYGTRYRWSGWLGQAFGICGALLLALARGARVGNGMGELLAILASFCYAAFNLSISRSRTRISARQALLWMSLGSLLTFLVLETLERAPLVGFTPIAWISFIGLGFVVQFIAWLLINHGLGHINIALGALGLSFQQVATLLLAAWLLHEPLRPLGMLGGAIIITGIYFVATGERIRYRSVYPKPEPAIPTSPENSSCSGKEKPTGRPA
jgi:drug/metabolite transporter (DMT)-like permease